MRPVVPGATSQSVILRILDATTFLPVTTVTSATSGLALVYKVGPTGTTTGITESDLSTETSAWSAGGMKHTDSGHYRVDIPDAAVPASEGVTTLISGVATGLIILPAVIVGRVVPLAPTTAGRTLDVSTDGDSEANVTKWSGTAIPGVDTAGYPKVTVKDGTGQGEIALTSGAVDSVTLVATTTTVTNDVGITQAAADKAWTSATRTLTAFGFSVTVGTNSDKTGYSLTAAYDPAKTAAQAGDAMTLTTGERTSVATAVWASGTRTLTSFGTLVADIWTASTAPTAAAIAAAVWTVGNMTTAAINKIADHVLRRTTANVEASSDGDTLSARSLYGASARLVHKIVAATGTLTVYKADDTAALTTATLTSDATADPTTAVDPAP